MIAPSYILEKFDRIFRAKSIEDEMRYRMPMISRMAANEQVAEIEYYTPDGILIADEAVGRAKGDKYPHFSTHRATPHHTPIAKAREARTVRA